ncbi:hypothetical protein GTP81_15115 [Rugamonas sp. FT107W]|uniref:Uncharacterized protein n=1 Tax=Duganella vulcania TaxID=2692166 RepID=A0A845HKT1_9BURK|nr:hypothetical protein [Duganella vulcania]MYN18089.1 hypothetical protein [Duganella vulcania]
MTIAKKAQSTSYKLEAALRRSRHAAAHIPLELEVQPTEGKIRVALDGRPIPRDMQESLFGPSAINIPEFGQARTKQGK